MNKNRYRLVFNQIRGALMAVVDFARSLGKGSARGGLSENVQPSSYFLGRLDPLAGSVLLAFLVTAASPSTAQIVAYKNAPGTQQATILTASNGVPLINIQTPSAAGVSRNTYSQFDVQGQGAIFNNARNNVQTQLGGRVQGNPWLATGTARVILNEILSSNPSQLLGYLEVGGDKAQIVIANPAGITCNGCGLINASRATFTTGVPLLENGNLSGYRVEGGRVRIEGAGMDMSRVDHTEILARAVEINAGLWAQTLTVAAGANRIDAANNEGDARVSPLADITPTSAADPAPMFAIDVARLGGMYANKIHLIGTEAGVGVRNAGGIGATAGDVIVTADGKLINKGSFGSAGNITLNTQGLDNTGTLSAAADLALVGERDTVPASRGDISNTGLISAGRELALHTDGTLDNRQGALDGQRLDLRADGLLNDQGTIRQTGLQTLSLTAQGIANSQGGLIGHAVADDNQNAPGNDAPGSNVPAAPVDITNPPTTAGGGDTLTLRPIAPTLLADGLITLSGDLVNAGGQILASGRMETTATAGLQNSATLHLDRLDVSGEHFNNANGDITAIDARIHAALLDNSQGRLILGNTLDLSVSDIINVQGTLLHIGTADLAITLDGRFDNTDGLLATNAAQLDLSASTLDNTGGTIEHAGSGAFTLTTGQLNDATGRIESQGALLLTAQNAVLDKADTLADTLRLTLGTLSNQAGRILQTGDGLAQVNIVGAFDNQGGALVSAGALTLAASKIDNRLAGQISAHDALDLSTSTLLNDHGQVSAGQNLAAKVAGVLDNTGGQIVAGADLNLVAGSANNTDGILGAVNGSLIATVNGYLDNARGRIEAASGLILDSRGLNNAGGSVLGQMLVINTHGLTLDNHAGGEIIGQDAATLKVGHLANNGGFIAGQTLAIDAASVDNRNTQGERQGIEGGILTLAVNTIDNRQGAVRADTDLTLHGTSSLDNRNGTLSSAGALALVTGTLSNQNGQIAAHDALDLTLGTLTNNHGQISAGQNLTARVTGALDNTSGQIVAGTDLKLAAGSVNNTAGLLGAVAGSLTATVNGYLNNAQGRIEAASDISIDSLGLNNTGGTVLGQTTVIDTHGQTLDNSAGGEILGQNAVTLDVGHLANSGDFIAAGQALTLDAAGALDNRGGTLASAGALTLAAGTLSNQTGQITATGAFDLTAGTLTNDYGQISAGQSLAVKIAGALDNTSGQIVAGTNLELNAGSANNTSGILGAVTGYLTATVNGPLNNTQGRIEAASDISVDSLGLNNTGGTVLGQTTVIDTHGQTLDNSAGGEILGQNAVTLTVGHLANAAGFIAAGQNLFIDAASVDNSDTLGQRQGIEGGALSLTAGALSNQAGRILQTGDGLAQVNIAGALDNRGGTLASADALTLAADDLDNSVSGQIAANDALDLTAGTLSNEHGQISAGQSLAAKITGKLDNTSGRIIAGTDLDLVADSVNNTSGLLGAVAGYLDVLVNGQLDNTKGRIEAASKLTLDSQGLNNAGGTALGQTTVIDTHGQALDNSARGEILAQNTLTLDVGDLDNSAGFIAAGQALTLNADSLDNSNTQGERRGIEGGVLTLTVDTINNTRGALRADTVLTLHSASTLDNTDGLISSAQQLAIEEINNGNGAPSAGIPGASLKTLAITNTGGVIVAGQDFVIDAASLTGGGKLLSQGDLSIKLTENYLNTGELTASHHASLATDGHIANLGILQAGESMTLSAITLDNTATGRVLSSELHLAADALTNRGLIDGGDTRIDVLTLDNLGAGRIFGDRIALAADTLNNTSENNVAPVIATRERLDIGVVTLRNTSGALISSAGDLILGGELDADAHAIGQVDTLINTGGTIEGGVLSLAAGSVDNRQGTMRANTGFTLDTGPLDNQGGTLSSTGVLTLTASAINNIDGVLIADQGLGINATRLTGKGKLLSQGDLFLDLAVDYQNTGELTASGNLSLTTTGRLDNLGLLQAGKFMELSATALDNAATGQILAPELDITAATLTNRGLIDGTNTRIDAGTLDNLGNGRIYGDRLALAADTLNNTPENGKAPVIAARKQLDLGVGTLRNTDGALIFSVGDLAIGRYLDADDHAVGQATSITNSSATIEALGNLTIDTASLINQKTAFEMKSGVPSTELPTGIERLAYLPDLKFHWPISEIRPIYWRNYVLDRYINLASKMLGGGPDARLVEAYNSTGEVDETGTWYARIPVTDEFVNVWDNLTGYEGLVGGGLLDEDYRAELASALKALPFEESHRSSIALWNLILSKISADHPEMIDAMAQSLAGQGFPLTSYERQCPIVGDDDCSHIYESTNTRTDTRDVVIVDTPAAIIRAGGSATITATTLDNRYSLIQSGGDMTLTGATLDNVGAELYLVSDTATITEIWHWVNRFHGTFDSADKTQTLIGSVPGLISAGGTLSGSFTGRIDNKTIRHNVAPVSQIGAAPGVTKPGGPSQNATGVGGSSQNTANASDPSQDADGASGAPITHEAQTDPLALDASGADGVRNAQVGQNALDASGADGAHNAQVGQGATGTSAAQFPPVAQLGQSVDGANGNPVIRVAQVSQANIAGSSGTVIATIAPALQLPTNALQLIHPEPDARYLVETDSRFIGSGNGSSSDKLLSGLNIDVATLQKRMGDGFYEQRLVAEQVSQITGRRFLQGHADDEAQYIALMNAGVTYANEWNLIPGVGLTAAQMAMLTSDIVWLVEQDVMLSDGTTQRVLVPQVYACVRDDDLTPSGALIAAKDIQLDTMGDLTNSGAIAGRQLVALTAENIDILRGRVTGQDVDARARNDLAVLGGTIEAEHSLIALAGHDLTVQSSTVDWDNNLLSGSSGESMPKNLLSANVQKSVIDRVAGLYVTGSDSQGGGTLIAAAGNDLTLIAAAIINAAPTAAGNASSASSASSAAASASSASSVSAALSSIASSITSSTNTGENETGNSTTLFAGNNLTLGTLLESGYAGVTARKSWWYETTLQEVGGTLITNGDLTLAAGNDLTARAATVISGGVLEAIAGNDLSITAGEAEQTTESYRKSNKSGFLSKTSKVRQDYVNETTALSSSFSGDIATLMAGNNLTVTGGNVVATGNLTATAGKDLTIEAATETHAETHYYKEKTSGLFSSGGIGFTIGSQMLVTDLQNQNVTALASTLGSVTGDVTLVAGDAYRQIGSEVLAPGGDIGVLAKSVTIEEAREESHTAYEMKAKQSGLTLALTSPVISAIQVIKQMSDAAGDTSDSRAQALAAASAGLAGYQGYQAIDAGQGKTIQLTDNTVLDNQIVTQTDAQGHPIDSRDANIADQIGGINLSISIGSSKSQGKSTWEADTAAGSTLAAGGDIRLIATGAGQDSDITVQGSQILAGHNLTLLAGDEIKLLAAQNTASQHGKNQSSRGSIGFSIGTDGFLFNAGASQARGKADGDDLAWTHTHLQAGDTLTLRSGGDTTLQGAVAGGNTLIADIGGNLLVESPQDTSTHDSKQKSAGFSLSIGAGRVSGAISVSNSKISSDYASVNEQSGLFAGDGGFQINIQGDTDLKGAVIASTQAAIDENKNSFNTGGALTLSDLENIASYKASSAGINLGAGTSLDGQYIPRGTSAGLGSDSGSTNSTTQAGISGIAGNPDVRTGDPRNGIEKIFDAAKVQKEIDAQVEITRTFGQQASKAVGD